MQLFHRKWPNPGRNAGDDTHLARIRDWFSSDLGRQLLTSEKGVIDELLAGLFGYHLMQVSILNDLLTDASQINHKLCLGLCEKDKGSLQASALELPFASDSIDLVLLHHILDFYQSPKNILKEAARVILPSGHLVILGFNPMSLWGLWKSVAKWSGNAPWNGSYIAPGRLMDWLNLLDFRIDRIHYLYNGPPLLLNRHPSVPDFSGGLRTNWPFGAIYVIVARKQVAGLTPLKPHWFSSRPLPQLNAVRSARQSVLSHGAVTDISKYRLPDDGVR